MIRKILFLFILGSGLLACAPKQVQTETAQKAEEEVSLTQDKQPERDSLTIKQAEFFHVVRGVITQKVTAETAYYYEKTGILDMLNARFQTFSKENQHLPLEERRISHLRADVMNYDRGKELVRCRGNVYFRTAEGRELIADLLTYDLRDGLEYSIICPSSYRFKDIGSDGNEISVSGKGFRANSDLTKYEFR